jgi:NAD(P)-dependent dehydrogenase (short-subunit alcohol dehydrogenase family)
VPSLARRFPLRRAFVTGAGSGLGRSLCLELAGQGFTIGVQDLRAPAAEETLREVVARGGRGRVYAFDVSDGAAFAEAAKDYRREHAGVDLLVNNAGVAVAAALLDMTREDWDFLLAANLRGPIEGCRAFVPAMRDAGAGHVVNVASVAGLVPTASMGAYCVTKYGVVAYTESLRLELQGSGVCVSLVCPFFFKTALAQSAHGEARLIAVAQWLMDLGWTSDRIARHVLRAVERNRFYDVLPQLEAKAFWALRRLSPRLYLWAAAHIHRQVLAWAPKPGATA